MKFRSAQQLSPRQRECWMDWETAAAVGWPLGEVQ
jgi:hypothetical protein